MKLKTVHREGLGMIRDSGILMIAGPASGFLYLLVHLYLMKAVGEVTYAMCASLLALKRVMDVPSSALMMSIARYVSQFTDVDTRAWVTIIRRALRRISILGVLALVLWIGISGMVRDALNVPSRLNVVILGVIVLCGLYGQIIQGTLQGSRKFAWMAGSGISNGLSRLVLCVLAVRMFGNQVSPILGAVAGSSLVALAVGYWPFRETVRSVDTIDGYDTGPVYNYLFPVLLGQGSVFLLMELDLILAPRFLVDAELAAYGKAAMITRCIFWVSQPVATVMFPRAVVSGRKWIIAWPLAFAGIIASTMSILVYLFPALPLRFLAPDATPLHAELLKMYVWVSIPLSLVSIMAPYLWARDRLGPVLRLVPIVLVYIVVRLVFFSDTPVQMILCLAVALCIAVVVLGHAMIPVFKESLINNDYKRILVFLLAGAGDTLLTTPMLRELKRAYPQADIDVLVMQGEPVKQVLSGNPDIHEVHFHDFLKEGIVSSTTFCLGLRKKRYDCLLVPVPHNRLAYNLIALLVGGRERIGFEYDIKCGTLSGLVFTKRIRENTSLHVVENNLRVVSEGLGLEVPEGGHGLVLDVASGQGFAKKFVKEHGVEGKRLVAIHPGSGTTKNLELKRWPSEEWGELARRISEEYGVVVLVLGGPEENGLKREVISCSGPASEKMISVDGGSVPELGALIERCACVVSGDTLVPHVAAAVGVPTAVIYGPTSHVAAYPYGTRYEIIWAGLACSPCYGFSRYGIRCTNEVYLKCLKDITVDMALAAVRELMD